MEKTLDREVRALLECRKGDWPHIAHESEVSYSWLSKFVCGRIKNPGYATLKRLHEFLTKNISARSAAGR